MTKFGSLVLVGTLLLPTAAHAQDFGTAGRFAIAAERITSINHSSRTSEDEDSDTSTSVGYTNIAFLANPLGSSTSGYSFPRIGLDYFVTDGLSVGAALGIIHSSSSVEFDTGETTVESDGPTTSGILFSPRVGYAFMFEDNIGIWPRAGFTYVGAGEDSEGDDGYEQSSRLLAFSLEVPFVYAPVPHVAFTAAPALDLGLSGSSEYDPNEPAAAPTVESDYKVTDVGLHIGMLAYF